MKVTVDFNLAFVTTKLEQACDVSAIHYASPINKIEEIRKSVCYYCIDIFSYDNIA